MTQGQTTPAPVSTEALREAVRQEYATVATEPAKGFHFHTGRYLAQLLGYRDEWLGGLPETTIEALAGTGNPLSMGEPQPGEHIVDVGSGSGLDSLIAARMVGPEGAVRGVDMTSAMLTKSRQGARAAGLSNVEFLEGYAESLPVESGWADLVIANGVLNLAPDKLQALREMHRVLKPGGRLQIADIIVQKEVPDSAKADIDLWTG